MNVSTSHESFLASFFHGEGGFCSLLHLLLTADTRAAWQFRERFAQHLEQILGFRCGAAPLNVGREVPVFPASEYGISNPLSCTVQKIDLVVWGEETVVGLELKARQASIKPGQLQAQYLGLRQDKRADDKAVHMVLLAPAVSKHVAKVTTCGTDRARGTTWDAVFNCYPSGQADEDEKILSRLVATARARLEDLKKQSPVVVSPRRLAVRAEMDAAVEIFNRRLSSEAGPLRGCLWTPHVFRGQRSDKYYAALRRPAADKPKGQHLTLLTPYSADAPLEPFDSVNVRVEFQVEMIGAKAYGSEWDARRDSCIAQLPRHRPRGVRANGRIVFDAFRVTFTESDGLLAAVDSTGAPARDMLAERLMDYARAFGEFLERDCR